MLSRKGSKPSRRPRAQFPPLSVVIYRPPAQIKDHFADLNVKPLQEHVPRTTPRPDFRATHPGIELFFEDHSPALADRLRNIGNVYDFIDQEHAGTVRTRIIFGSAVVKGICPVDIRLLRADDQGHAIQVLHAHAAASPRW